MKTSSLLTGLTSDAKFPVVFIFIHKIPSLGHENNGTLAGIRCKTTVHES